MDNQSGQQGQKEYKLLTEGVFRARPVKGALTGTQEKPQYAVAFMFCDGPNAGKQIGWWGGFKGGGLDYTVKALKVLGWDTHVGLDTWSPDPKLEVNVNVVNEKIPASPGKPERMASKAKWINALDGGGGDFIEKMKMDDAPRKAAANTIAQLLAAKTGGAAPSGDVNSFDAGGSSEGGGEDELPF